MAGLYFHIPYCRSKCSYCDFYSLVDPPISLEAYVELMLRQIRQEGEAGGWGPFASVFFGGGTPSLLTPEAVSRLLGAARNAFGFLPGVEISLEVNPGTVTEVSLEGYRRAGVNRLSLGLQSFDDAALVTLGRRHTAAQGREAIAMARRAGFENLSGDWIFACSGQDEATLWRECDAYLALELEHLSCYSLTVEPDTPLARQAPQLPDEEVCAELFLALDRWLTGAGYEHYEISNYARFGRRCRHNESYWRREAGLGIGAGAHSFVCAGWGERWAVPSDLVAFAATMRSEESPRRIVEAFDRQGAMSESVYLALRTVDGVDFSTFSTQFGMTPEEVFAALPEADRAPLRDGVSRWRMTPEQWLLYDHLILPFL